ncbi:MAG: DUF1801 domain-containing protein [Bifidobacteriaceae bacterium]|jgi:uncharacterized protein YdhG (YjbR/CyaY superfamily)|nr:DUF1801 domain-containing protein [Bifidobacteriaceae bacterium]
MSVITDYIAQQPEKPEAVRAHLTQMYHLIKGLLPDAYERLSYSMPAFSTTPQGTNIVYFAAAKKHLGFYPTASGVVHFTTELDAAGISWSKGAIQFPWDHALPIDLITDIVKFRRSEVETGPRKDTENEE